MQTTSNFLFDLRSAAIHRIDRGDVKGPLKSRECRCHAQTNASCVSSTRKLRGCSQRLTQERLEIPANVFQIQQERVVAKQALLLGQLDVRDAVVAGQAQ